MNVNDHVIINPIYSNRDFYTTEKFQIVKYYVYNNTVKLNKHMYLTKTSNTLINTIHEKFFILDMQYYRKQKLQKISLNNI